MKHSTLLIPFNDKEILLPMKKSGFGAGFYNGYGGKIKPTETPIQALLREVYEESNYKLSESEVQEIGEITFHFENNPSWNDHVLIYKSTIFDAKETDEMKPFIFPLDEIPYSKMWPADCAWFPHVIKERKVSGIINFSSRAEYVIGIDLSFSE